MHMHPALHTAFGRRFPPLCRGTRGAAGCERRFPPLRRTSRSAAGCERRFPPLCRASRSAAGASMAAPDAGSDALTFAALRDELREFAAERDWNQFHTPRNLCLALTGEVGEVAECLQWRPDAECAPGLPAWTEAEKAHLGEELADCLMYLVRLADRSGVDLAAAAVAKLAKNRAKYPKEQCKGSAAKYTSYTQPEEPPAKE